MALLLLYAVALAPAKAGGGFDTARLSDVVAQARSLERLNTLIVARNGEVAFAESFRGRGLDTPVNVKSVSKSLIAALVGIAVDRGLLEGPDQNDRCAIGRSASPQAADPRVRRHHHRKPAVHAGGSRTHIGAQLRALGAKQ